MPMLRDDIHGYSAKMARSGGRLFSSSAATKSSDTLNLSVPARTDWLTCAANVLTRKAGAGSTIGLAFANNTYNSYSGTNPPATSWTDGDNPASGGPYYTTWYADAKTALSVAFTITVPVGKKPILIEVYYAVNAASLLLSATLSDGSAPALDFSMPQIAGDQNYRTFITASAASEGQTLTITVGTNNSTGNNGAFYSVAYRDA